MLGALKSRKNSKMRCLRLAASNIFGCSAYQALYFFDGIFHCSLFLFFTVFNRNTMIRIIGSQKHLYKAISDCSAKQTRKMYIRLGQKKRNIIKPMPTNAEMQKLLTTFPIASFFSPLFRSVPPLVAHLIRTHSSRITSLFINFRFSYFSWFITFFVES